MCKSRIIRSRYWLVGLSIVAMVSVAADDPENESTAKSAEMIVDPNWTPKPGDRVETNAVAPGLSDYAAYLKYEKHSGAHDQPEIQRMIDSKQVSRITKGTKVLIIKSYRPEKPSPVYRSGLSADAARRAMQASILNPQEETGTYPVEVRILDGEFQGRVKFIPDTSVAKLIPAPPVKGFALRLPGASSFEFKEFRRPFLQAERRPRGKAGDPTTRAANLLRAGQKAEKSGDVVVAVSAYWFTSKEFPGTEPAQKAIDRLAAMGFKRDPDGRNYRLDLVKAKKR